MGVRATRARGAEWGVKKSISDEGERWKERKVTPNIVVHVFALERRRR